MPTPAAGSSGQQLPCGSGWDGGGASTWRSNLEHAATGILLTQRERASPAMPPVFEDFWAGVDSTRARSGT